MSQNLNLLSATVAAKKIADQEISAEELIRSCLERIEEREQTIGAFEFIDPEAVIAQARRRDAEASRGPLHGIPIGVKDIIDTVDMPTQKGSPIYVNHQPEKDAACVASIKAAGAVIIGKTVTTEFATFTPGKTANPHNTTHTPGGSSSGSAAGVADWMMPIAYGTQTSGSVIRPSSFCGVAGFKPSFGMVSRMGVLTIVPSFDCVGYMARCFDDLALTHSVLVNQPYARLDDGLGRPPKIGICRSHQWPKADRESKDALETATTLLEKFGANIQDITLPGHFAALEAAHATIMDVALSQNLRTEYDTHLDQISDRLRERIERGIATDTNTFLKALALAAKCRTEINILLAEWDCILTPSAPGVAPEGFSITGVPTFNMIWTLLHLPCVNIPGLTGPKDLPVGVQLVSRYATDMVLLAVGKWLHNRLTA